ncbi:MAG: ferredoxin family protein [Promethearchaeota archaeon]
MVIKIEKEFCKGCGYCIEICPKHVFKESNKLNKRGYLIPEINDTDSCIFCKKCELICPEMCISVKKMEKEK